MLTSETTDLIGSCSDVEGEKGHVNETEHDLNDMNDTWSTRLSYACVVYRIILATN